MTVDQCIYQFREIYYNRFNLYLICLSSNKNDFNYTLLKIILLILLYNVYRIKSYCEF